MMQQFYDFKGKHPDALLLFRCGDFYETYGEDAVIASQILGITLTRRNNGAGGSGQLEMAGFPYHALDSYLPKLIRAGRRVAICDQLEDPKLTKKLVKRGITELVTPGIAMQDNLFSYKENNFLCAIDFGKGVCGISLLDISTGEFVTSEGTIAHVQNLINRFAPKEVLYECGRRQMLTTSFGDKFSLYEMQDWVFNPTTARSKVLKHFGVKSLKGYGVDHMNSGVTACGVILEYLAQTQHTRLGHILRLSRIEDERYVHMDGFTIRSLELFQTMNPDGRSLMDVISRTITPMGARTLSRWLAFPLKDTKLINTRLNIVEHL